MSDPRLVAWDPSDGEPTERRVMRALEIEGFEVAVYSYPPGTVFDWHEHAFDKCDAVLDGTLRIELPGGAAFDLSGGARLYLPAGTRHRAQVRGPEGVVSLDATRWP